MAGVSVIAAPSAPPPAPRTKAAVPATVSARRHLRDGLPEIYADGSFGMRFLRGLEEVLDPIFATLDSLPAHLDCELAPEHALAGLAAWLGVDEVEALPAEQRREAVRRAGELARWRGTRAGLQLALELFFPGIPMRIDDHGAVTVSEDAGEEAPHASAPSFDVYCDKPLRAEDQMAVAGCIERWKPVHARYRLRVRKGDTGETMAVPPPDEDGPR
jgi:phage tail-like protein